MKERTKMQNLLQQGYLLKLLVSRNIKNQYYRSVLGVLWTVLNPLLNMIVMALVFTNIFGRNTDGLDYPVYVLSGNIVFSLMRSATAQALPCLVEQRDMLQKTRVPLALFPTSNVFSAVVTFIFSMVALIVVMLFRMSVGVVFHWQMLLTLVMLPALILFSLGLSFFLSALFVFFRDLKHFYSVFLTLWMYMTPLFYTVSILSSGVRKFLYFNPMYYYVEYFRDLLMGRVPDLNMHLMIFALGIGMLVLGLAFLKMTKNKIAAKL